MKKLVVLLAVALLAVPALGVTITGSATGADVTLAYTTTGTEALRGVALTIELVGGTLAGYGDVTLPVDTEFNAFIDYYVANPVSVPPAQGAHPLCNPNAPGVAVLPASVFGICMGYLDEDGDATLGEAAPGVNKNLIKFKVTCASGPVQVMVSLDDLRGGIVGDNLTAIVVPAEAIATATCGPVCWTYACFAKGDTNGDGKVNFVDLGAVKASFNKPVGGGYNPCADFNKDGKVNFLDLGILKANFNKLC